VGAVARDRAGRLAAATSTGGTFGKRAGRVGDTPLIGVGTWADTDVAASCTGIGECFILAGGAGEIGARMRLAGETVEQATAAMLARVRALGGDGGVIALDRQGRWAMPFNSGGMKRALAREDGTILVAIY
jgi:L-asparaginase/beta-aspartyl-peptidase (threonine type)